MTTTTDHIKALLVDDGREFAMIRKTDLAALMQIAQADPHQGRFLDPIGAHKVEISILELALTDARHEAQTYWASARNHGEERRRYMANNKALLAAVDQKDFVINGYQMLLRQKDRYEEELAQLLIKALEREASLEARLLRVARFKRKFPSIGRIMDLTP